MKIKRIMLITFLLLAVLAIGAVSAADDVASDNMTVSDDADVIAADDEDDIDYGIEINKDKIYIDEDDDEYYEYETIAEITLPEVTKGSFQILNGEDVVTQLDVDDTVIARLDDEDGDEHWEYDEDYGFEGTIYLEDFDLTKVHDGDVLSFKFFKYTGGKYVEDKSYTKLCNVSLTDTIMKLFDGNNEIEGEINVHEIDLNNPDENFTYVNVTQMEGIFRITLENDDNTFEIFNENLNTTGRRCTEFNDEEGNHYYIFSFSLTDINNYIAEMYDGDSLNGFIDKKIMSTGDEMYFELIEDDEDETEIDSLSMTITIKDEKILFDDEDDVDIDYNDLDIVMTEGWNETVILRYVVQEGIDGKIVIYLNDNQTASFEKQISEMEPKEDEDEDEFYYNITISDLNITGAGEYVLRCYFYDENGDPLYEYDKDYPEILKLYPAQIVTGENATISVNPVPISVDANETIITINATDDGDDVVTVYIDGDNMPLTFKLAESPMDTDGNYIITSEKLNLGVGNHTLNITCKGTNIVANVTIVTDLEIELLDEEDTAYTTFNDAFAFITLEEGDITTSHDITGKINVTLTDSTGNVTQITFDIDDINIDANLEALAICTNDMGIDLNGKYYVVVKYFDGNKGIVQTEGNVTFKSFNPEDYGTSINDTITNDNIITFTDHLPDCNIKVEIDGNRTVKIEESDLNKGFDQQGNIFYSIKQNKLRLTDGPHSISIYIDNNGAYIELGSKNVIVDLEENFDLGLTIIAADIEEGKIANVEITTNSTFTGDILVQVANQNRTVNVVNGKGSLSLTSLKAGTYTVTATYKSNGIFADSTKTKTFKVTSKPVTPAKKANVIKLTLKKVKIKKSAKKLVLKATLKINGKAVKGKKVIFKFKGKKYTGKTNKKGVAKVTIKKKVLKKLKVGKKVTYSAKYSTKTVKKTVKVKK